MRAAIPVVLCLCTLPLFSCLDRERIFRREVEAACQGRQGEELLQTLIALDQQHPNSLLLKVNLGAVLLASGRVDQAHSYLLAGEKLARRSRDRHLKYLLYANLAEHGLRKLRYEQSTGYAGLALGLEPADDLGVVFTRAKARFAAGNNAQALEDFNCGYRERRERMNREDISTYILALARAGKHERALSLCRERQLKYGFLPGQGLEESALLEHLGRIDEAVLAAFMELEYKRGRERISEERILANLTGLQELLRGRRTDSDRENEAVISGLRAYLAEEWRLAEEMLEEVRTEPAHPFLQYLILSAALEQRPSSDQCSRYVELETYFRDLQPYYYHLWRGLSRGAGLYNLETARGVLEKTILLAPSSLLALSSREELGRLLGLSAQQGRALLLEAELDLLLRRIVEQPYHSGSEQDFSLLEPVLQLLALPDNLYTNAALLMLREAALLPGVRPYLEERKTKVSGRLKERLIALLGP